MRFSRSSVWAVGLSALLLIGSWRTAAVAQGGAFVPSLDYAVTGAWSWLGTSPLSFFGPVNNGFKMTFAFTQPTANRTITYPDATGTNVITPSVTQSRLIAGQVDLAATNPTSVVTGLSALTGCTANIFGTTTGANTAPYIVWVQYTTVAGRLDLFGWTTTGSATHAAAIVSYVCVGQF